MAKPIITHDELLSLLRYDPETGHFYWLVDLCRSRQLVGKVAGFYGNKYVEMKIHRRNYLAHRLAYFYMTGTWPEHQIDHINMCPTDNRWDNLRPATSCQNMANTLPLSTNKCGLKGVRFVPSRGNWRATIYVKNRAVNLGSHKTKEAAYEAYCQKARELHGEFARL